MIAKVTYKGDLRNEALHLVTGSTIELDAPKDNQGKGEAFAPTDLVAATTAACMMAIMDLYARRHGLDLKGTTAAVEKTMDTNSRRIAEIKVTFEFPHGESFSTEHRQALERTALDCPISRSLHPDLKQTLVFNWQQQQKAPHTCGCCCSGKAS
ncbi:MAG: OsmC family protein [Deltaproteobacteria bacterium]|nr:OsmC family protein [Deltaproteobacteria bacterium]